MNSLSLQTCLLQAGRLTQPLPLEGERGIEFMDGNSLENGSESTLRFGMVSRKRLRNFSQGSRIDKFLVPSPPRE